MGNHIQWAIGISLFIVFFTMTATAGNFDTYVDNKTLNEYNLTKQDLELSPNIPQLETNEISITDYIKSENITVEKFNNSDPDYGRYDKGLTVQDNKSKGSVLYDISNDANELRYVMSKCNYSFFGLFLNTNATFTAYNNNGNKILSEKACGDTTGDLNISNERVDTVQFNITSNATYLYELEERQGGNPGILSGTFQRVSAIFNGIGSWFTLITGLPGILVWFSLAFGIIALLVIIEYLTF